MIAAQRGCKEAVEVLLEYEKGMSDSQNHNALLGSQEWAHRSRQDRHSSRGPDGRGRATALMRAAARGDAEVVELLIPLQKGAKDKDGNAALVHALRSKHEGIALLLSNTNHAPFQRSA